MIKLTLPPCPAQLTLHEQLKLVAKFKANKKTRVWATDYIRNALSDMTHGKCAYSEVPLGEEGKYMEVDHFKCKDKYPDEVVRWGNLLPVSKVCNVKKGDLDVVKIPIVNPLEDEPKEHLYVKKFLYIRLSDKGENTIKNVALNSPQFVDRRGRICVEIEKLFGDVLVGLDQGGRDEYWVNRVMGRLKTCNERSAYSAVIATYILYESEGYRLLKKTLEDSGYWDSDFDQIEAMLDRLALPKP